MLSIDDIKNKFKNLRLQCDSGCHKASKYGIALFSSVYRIPYEHWNKVLNGENLLLSIPYLAALENDPARDMEFHYAIVYLDDKPQAILYFQEFDFKLNSVDDNVDVDKVKDAKSLLQKAKDVALKSFQNISARLLTFGNSFVSGEHGFHYTSEFDTADLGFVINAATEKICSLEGKKGNIKALLAKDFYHDKKDCIPQLMDNYHQFKVQPNMILPLEDEWKTFDDYLEAMSSKYRVRARSAMKKGDKVVTKELDADQIAELNGTLLELYNSVESSANFQLATIGKNYFLDLKAALEDNFKFWGYYLEDELIGFASAFVGDGHLEAHYVGIDYKWNVEVALYQNMLYDYVRMGLACNAKQISYGRTALEIKSTVGAEPHEMMLFLRANNSLTHKIMKPFIENIRQEEWIQRRPFKKGSNKGQDNNDKKQKTEKELKKVG